MSFQAKLVRDKIPEIIEKSGKSCRHSVLTDAEYDFYLIEKLQEELSEFAETPCLEEAADIYEVFLSMLKNWKLEMKDVMTVAEAKRDLRGGFSEKILLEHVDKNEDT
jgi:predicted house-cleaning noncanonical NTP pyrophosphatase (MazG superfamily)